MLWSINEKNIQKSSALQITFTSSKTMHCEKHTGWVVRRFRFCLFVLFLCAIYLFACYSYFILVNFSSCRWLFDYMTLLFDCMTLYDFSINLFWKKKIQKINFWKLFTEKSICWKKIMKWKISDCTLITVFLLLILHRH